MTPAAELASLLLDRLGITGKPDLTAVCRRLGLRVKEERLSGAHGTLVRSKSAQKGIITVKASLREAAQKRFTIAHEIGHFIIPYHKELGNVCDARVIDRYGTTMPRPELEANEFAAELILPSKLISNRLPLKHPSLDPIGTVAREFEASLTATTWRYLDLTDLPCAMVWSEAGKAVWYRTSEALPYKLPLRDLPTEQSIAGRLCAGKEVTSRADKVDPQLWFYPSQAERISLLIEESLPLPSYDAVLTLLWVAKMEPPALAEDEELLPELDPEEFTLRRPRWPR
ncbi:MAG: ImmA/IrrE family metallo-endopeptidase [Bryobacteraceae bacterium]